jgi:undecaprenyl-phosphate galactose phosphotransferase
MKPIDSFLIHEAKQTKWFCRPEIEKSLLATTDLLALTLAFLGSSAITSILISRAGAEGGASWWASQNFTRITSYFVLMICTVVAFGVKGHYSKRRPYSNEAREILSVSMVLALVDASIVFFGKWQFSRASLLLTWLLAPCMLLGGRTVLKLLLIQAGGWIRPMVIVGWGENAIETALAFESERLMGYAPVAFLVPAGQANVALELHDRHGRKIPCLSLGKKPDVTIESLGNPHVVLALEQGGIERYQDIIQELGRRRQNIQIVPSIRGLPLYGMEVNHFFAHEVVLLTVRNNLARSFPRAVKRAFDITVSLAIIIAASPLLIWIAARVASSGGAIFYGHKRQGQYNRPFACYKFRSMAPNADQLLQELLANDAEARAEWERDFKLKNDPRITKIGHFLRKTSLDELPQLWNVLKGDMSLVGPRPVVAAELERYGNQVEYYLEAKPGITGLWQISGRNDITYETRVYLDAWYVKNWSLFNDIAILCRTVGVIFRKEGAY